MPIFRRSPSLSGFRLCFRCMVYGPIAAYLVEAFPASIRYTSVSLPYHIGNGVFGGLAAVIGVSSAPPPATSMPGSFIRFALPRLSFIVGMIF